MYTERERESARARGRERERHTYIHTHIPYIRTYILLILLGRLKTY